MKRSNPDAKDKVATCSFCGCRTCIVQHWYTWDVGTRQQYPDMRDWYLNGDACRSCIPMLEAMSPEEGEALLTARIVAQKLEQR